MLSKIINKLTSKYLDIAVFLSVFIILGLKTANLGLLLDDNVHLFPALIGTYKEYFLSYFYGYGFFRPLTLPFFYFIYSFYIFSPAIAHIFLFSMHFFTGIIFKNALESTFGKKISFFLSLIYITFPFFTEQYGWIAASNSLVANLLFMVQLYVIFESHISSLKKIIYILLAQILSIFFYESVFFAFVPIAFLLGAINKESLKKSFNYLLIFSLPSLGYYLLRSFVFIAHDPNTIRNITLVEFTNGQWINLFINNLSRLASDLQFLLFSKGAFIFFWKYTFVEGILSLYKDGFLFLMLIVFSVGIFIYITKNKGNKSPSKLPIYFLLLSIFTALPALLVKVPSYPFRVISLPIFFLVIFIFLIIDRISKKLNYLLLFIIIVFNLIFSQQMLQAMSNQFDDDQRNAADIVSVLDSSLEAGQKINILVNNIPQSTQIDFTYGEYLGSCISTDWCLLSLMSKYTDKVAKVEVNKEYFDDQVPTLEFYFDRESRQLIPQN